MNKGRLIYFTVYFFLFPFYLLHVAERWWENIKLLFRFLAQIKPHSRIAQRWCVYVFLHEWVTYTSVVFISILKWPGVNRWVQKYSVFLGCNCRVMALLSQQSWKWVWSMYASCGGHRAFGWKLPVCSLHTPFHHIAASLPPVISTHKRPSVVCVRMPAFCTPSQVSCKRSAEIS